MYPAVKSVRPLRGYRLELEFDTEEIRIFDMKPYLGIGMFAQLKEESVFETVHVSFDTVEWDNGVDFDPEALYTDSIVVTTSRSGSRP